MKRLFWIAFAGLLMVGPPASAHGQIGPHKGQMLLVGAHRFEMVVGQSSFTIYVMDMRKKVLPLKGITGSVEIHSDNDKTTNKVALTVEGDHLIGKFDLKKLKTAEVHAKIMVDGKEATVAFEYPPD